MRIKWCVLACSHDTHVLALPLDALVVSEHIKIQSCTKVHCRHQWKIKAEMMGLFSAAETGGEKTAGQIHINKL